MTQVDVRPPTPHMLVSKGWVQACALVLLFGFTVMGGQKVFLERGLMQYGSVFGPLEPTQTVGKNGVVPVRESRFTTPWNNFEPKDRIVP